jgi:hypothetical protein
MSPFAEMVRDLLHERHVAEWSIRDKYTLDHGQTGLNLWICSGRGNFRPYSGGFPPFTFRERWALWPLAIRMASLVGARKLVKASAPEAETLR